MSRPPAVRSTAAFTAVAPLPCGASAAFCGKNGSVLLLMSDENRSAINSFVKPNGLKIFQGYVFGGTGSMSYDSMKALEDATK